MANQAKASFNHGVLEITVPAPPEQVSRGRRLEISQGERNQGEKKSDRLPRAPVPESPVP